MVVLAVDTSSETSSVALALGQNVAEVVPLASEWKSTTLHQEIYELLQRHQVTALQVDGYAVTTGPGPFTGLRVGMAAVKGLAEVTAKKVVGLSTLELLALATRKQQAMSAGYLAPVMDARRGQVFGAMYSVKDSESLSLVIPEEVCSLKVFLEQICLRLSEGDEWTTVRICSTNVQQFSEGIAAAGWDASHAISAPRVLAGVLAEVGRCRLQRGLGQPPEAIEANYVRLSDAEMLWKG